MDDRIKSLNDKRNQLGWTLRELAEKAGLRYGDILKILSKGSYCDIYGSKIRKALNKGLRDKKKKEEAIVIKSEIGTIAIINPYVKLPQKKEEKKWARKYDECVECGTTEEVHCGHGLCWPCWNFLHDEDAKSHQRIRGIAINKLTKKYLLEEYVKKKKSLNEIAKEAYCTRQYVYKRIKHYQIPLRNKAAASDIALRKGKVKYVHFDDDGSSRIITRQKADLNENFFSFWSDEMAYVLGMIYTDGSLYKNKMVSRVTITQKEPEILNKILILMKCDAQLFFRPEKQYKSGISGSIHYFHIHNKKIFSDLLKIGLTPNKSLTAKFPTVPQEYVRHFIRGCWDGDGTVSIYKRDNRISAGFVSGSIDFINGMHGELLKAGFSQRKIYVDRRGKNPSYSFKFSRSQCKELYHCLYDDVPPEQFLQRKHDVFSNYFVGD